MDSSHDGLYIFSAVSLLWVLLFRRKSAKKEKILVSEVIVYPIKSCRGIRLKCSKIAKTGLLYDRQYMIIDGNNKFISQRSQPMMALIETSICYETKTLTVSAPNMEDSLIIDLNHPGSEDTIEVSVWDDRCVASEAVGPIGNAWFCKLLQLPSLKFVRMRDDFVRSTSQKYAPGGQTSFSDGYPFLLCSTSSLELLNSKLTKSVDMINFRPNIVVQCSEPFAEDTWGDIEIIRESSSQKQSVFMSVVKPCSRCKIPTIDPVTAQFDPENEPTRTMRTFRTGRVIGFEEMKWQGEVHRFHFLFSSGRNALTRCSSAKTWITKVAKAEKSTSVIQSMFFPRENGSITR